MGRRIVMGRYGKKIISPAGDPAPRICIGCETICILRCTGKCSSGCKGTASARPASEKNSEK